MVDGRDAQAPPSSQAKSDPMEERDTDHSTEAKSPFETTADDFSGKWSQQKNVKKRTKSKKKQMVRGSRSKSATFTPPPLRFDSTGFTLESVLERYGRLRNMRVDIYVSWFLLFATSLYSTFWETRDILGRYDGYIRLDGSPLCCCPQSTSMKQMLSVLKETYQDQDYVAWLSFAAYPVAGFTAPFWERYGRRRVILIAIVVSSITLLIMALIYDQKMTFAMIFFQMLTSHIIYLSILINFIELLPFTKRTWAIVGMEMMRIDGPVLSMLLLSYPLVPSIYYHLIFGLINIAAYFVVMRYTRESLCHLIVTGRIEEADDRVLNEELKLTREVTGASIDHSSDYSSVSDKYAREMGIAQLITDSLAFTENEGYGIVEFLRRLPRSDVVYRIIYCIFAVFACGMVSRCLSAQLNEMRLQSPVHMFMNFLANIIAMCSLPFVRKWSRVRAMIILMALIILTLCARASMVRHRPDRCSHHVVLNDLLYPSALLTVISSSLNDILYQSILLHSGENSPSRMRIPILTLNMLIKELTVYYFGQRFIIEDDRMEIMWMLVLGVYLSVLMIVGIMYRRTLDRDNFAIFMKDLVPRRKYEEFKEVDCEEMTEAEAAMKIPDLKIPDLHSNVMPL